MNALVILLGGRDALLAPETFLTCIYIEDIRVARRYEFYVRVARTISHE